MQNDKAAAARLRKALQRDRGDNLERCRMAYRHCTPTQMQEVPFAGSGQTRNEILRGYQQDRIEWENAKSLLERLLQSNGL